MSAARVPARSEARARRGLWLGLACLLAVACAQESSPGLPGVQATADSQFDAWKRQTAQLRGLGFLGPVRVEQLRGDEIAQVVRTELSHALTPQFARRYADAYSALGLLPPRFDLIAALESLYESELAGLYSPHRRTMFVRDELGRGQEPTVIHELVHALQHQHFPRTLELMQAVKRNDDVVTSLGCAIEGDASFTMLGIDPKSPLGRDPRSAAEMRDAMLSSLLQGGGPMAPIPRIIRYSLVFPYAHGTVLAARSYQRGGNAGLDQMMVRGPLSTRQVLYPDVIAPVEFVLLPFDTIAARLEARGCTLGENNVAGALSLEVLFEEHGDMQPAESLLRSWSGDRFLQVDCEGTWELIWVTRWDTPGATEEFARRYYAIAGAIAKAAPLSGRPRVLLSGRTAVVLTPGVLDLASVLQKESEVRSYDTVEAWIADDCFTESPCPGL